MHSLCLWIVSVKDQSSKRVRSSIPRVHQCLSWLFTFPTNTSYRWYPDLTQKLHALSVSQIWCICIDIYAQIQIVILQWHRRFDWFPRHSNRNPLWEQSVKGRNNSSKDSSQTSTQFILVYSRFSVYAFNQSSTLCTCESQQ